MIVNFNNFQFIKELKLFKKKFTVFLKILN